MTNARALTRVRRDLAAGHQRAALRRLRTMLAADPGDLEVYRLLTEANRAAGNPAEAGRWGYLTGDATDEEIRAFETAHPQPWIRLQLLGWQGGVEALPNPVVRARLIELQHQVTESTVPLRREAGSAARQAADPDDQQTQTLPPGPTGPAGSTGIPVQRSAPEIERMPAGQPVASGPQQFSAAGQAPTGGQAPAGSAGAALPPGAAGAALTGAVRPRPASGRQSGTAAPGREFPRPPAGRAPAARGSLVARMTRPQDGRRSFAAGLRNYAILAALIIVGTLGSIGAVGGLRALFGVKNWPAPVRDLIEAIIDLVTR